MRIAFYILFIAKILSLKSVAQSGSLDLTFNSTGIRMMDIGDANAMANGIAIQNDGKIVMAGFSSRNFQNEYALVRLMPDGSNDLSFGDSGVVQTDFMNSNDYATQVLVEPNTGRIIAAGYSDNGNGLDFSLACYGINGVVDSSFGNNGRVITQLGTVSSLKSLLIQPDGKIVVSGHTNVSGFNVFAVVRYNNDGSIDNSFNGAGSVIIPFIGFSAVANAMLLQPDGKIVIAGQVENDTTLKWDFALARINSDGTIDNGFGVNGRVKLSSGGTDDVIRAMTIQPDGRIIVAGHIGTTPSNNNYMLARFNSNGTLDASFGTGGIVVSNLPGNKEIMTALLQPDGKIVIGGTLGTGISSDLVLLRFNTNGTADFSFGVNGRVTTDAGQFDNIYSMQLQQDEKLVVAGTAFAGNRFKFVAARYEMGTITSADENVFSFNNLTVFPNPASDHINVTYNLSSEAPVKIELLDITGKSHAIFKNAVSKAEGKHDHFFMLPADLVSGYYFVRLTTGSSTQTSSLIIK